jgi:hypothetical protein
VVRQIGFAWVDFFSSISTRCDDAGNLLPWKCDYVVVSPADVIGLPQADIAILMRT